MKILHVDEQTGWRGGEQQASWLMQGLARRGHAIALAGRPGSPFATRDHGGIEIERTELPFRNEADLASAWKLGAWAREHKVDVIHAHSSHAHMFAVLSRQAGHNCRIVVSRRVSFPPKSNPINRWKYRRPDKFVSVSGEVDRVLRDFGVPDDRRAIVHSSVDFDRLNVAPIARAVLGVPENVPLLVSAGALVGHKDHANFIDAFRRVRKDFPDARAVIAGEGPLREDLVEQVANLGLRDCVHFLGHREDVPAIIRAADVYVSSSWSEGLGTSVLEALGCETPVVATVAGGVPEMVIDGATGHLVPNRDPGLLANAIVRSLQDRGAARTMAKQGRRLVEEKFSVDRMVEGTLRVYEELLARRNGT